MQWYYFRSDTAERYENHWGFFYVCVKLEFVTSHKKIYVYLNSDFNFSVSDFKNVQSAPYDFYSNLQATRSFRFIMVGNKLVCQQNFLVSNFVSWPYLSTFLYIMFELQFCEH